MPLLVVLVKANVPFYHSKDITLMAEDTYKSNCALVSGPIDFALRRNSACARRSIDEQPLLADGRADGSHRTFLSKGDGKPSVDDRRDAKRAAVGPVRRNSVSRHHMWKMAPNTTSILERLVPTEGAVLRLQPA